MELNMFLVTAGGLAVLGVGGYGWWNWSRLFRAPTVKPLEPAPVPVAQAKTKRKYTRKPKVVPATVTNAQQLQEQLQQTGLTVNGTQMPYVDPMTLNGHANTGDEHAAAREQHLPSGEQQ